MTREIEVDGKEFTVEIEQGGHGAVSEFTAVGDCGFYRIEGPFPVEKDGTIWEIACPNTRLDANVHVDRLRSLCDDYVVLIAEDGTTVGGGKVTDVMTEETTVVVMVDQYAMDDPS